VKFLRTVAKHGAVAFLISYGFTTTAAREAEPVALAKTAYHVFRAWIGVTTARVRSAARSVGDSATLRSLSRVFSSRRSSGSEVR
jgi:hypothetical protein